MTDEYIPSLDLNVTSDEDGADATVSSKSK